MYFCCVIQWHSRLGLLNQQDNFSTTKNYYLNTLIMKAANDFQILVARSIVDLTKTEFLVNDLMNYLPFSFTRNNNVYTNLSDKRFL